MQSSGQSTASSRAVQSAERRGKSYPARIAELRFALGHLPEKDSKFEAPPRWVIATIKGLLAGPLNYVAELSRLEKEDRPLTNAEHGKAAGIISAFLAFHEKPPESILLEESQRPSLAVLRNGPTVTALRRVAEKSHFANKAHEESLDARARAQFGLGFHEGFGRVLDRNGVPIDDGYATTEIRFALWWFWPELKFVSSVKEIHQWLGELSPTKFGRKTVEAVCTEIGIFKTGLDSVPTAS